jgi:hypothetical protein
LQTTFARSAGRLALRKNKSEQEEEEEESFSFKEESILKSTFGESLSSCFFSGEKYYYRKDAAAKTWQPPDLIGD